MKLKKLMNFWEALMRLSSSLLWMCAVLGFCSTLGCYIFSPNAAPYVATAWLGLGAVIALPWWLFMVFMVLAACIGGVIYLIQTTRQAIANTKESFRELF